MNLIVKLETLLNQLLFKLGGLIARVVPKNIKRKSKKFHLKLLKAIRYIKRLPLLLFKLLLNWVKEMKASLVTSDIKAGLIESYKKAIGATKGLGAIKRGALTPFLMVSQWLRGLSPVQGLILLTFSSASILSVIGIGFSGQKLLKQANPERHPASVEEEVLYERPGYYKKETRHYDLTNLRLPVYVAQVNEIKSVDVDFTATLSNRHSKMFLEKNEFPLRDHLILHVEPSIASFPLEVEGKEIIRQKLFDELNLFLREHNIEGEVLELKITYVLAN